MFCILNHYDRFLSLEYSFVYFNVFETHYDSL